MIFKSEFFVRNSAWLSAVLFLIIGFSSTFYFGASGYYSRILASAGLAIIVVLGLNLLTGLAGQLSLGHAGFYALGAYTTAILSIRAELPIPLSMVIGIAISALFGVLLAIPALRVAGPYLAMVTLAFGIIVHSIAVNFPKLTGGAAGIFPVPKLHIFGYILSVDELNSIICDLASIGFYSVGTFINSRWGRALRAISGNQIAAASAGIPIVHGKRLAFVLSAALAGMAGTIYAGLDSFVSPAPFHFEASILFLTMLMVGGIGTLWGPVIGVVIMTVLDRALSDMTEIRLGIYALAMLLIIRFVPGGIVGIVKRGIRRALPNLHRSHTVAFGSKEGSTAFEHRPESSHAKSKVSVKLQVDNITRRFGELVAIKDVSMTVKTGAIQAIVGPNGAGKTSLFNIISGIDHPNKGVVCLDEKEITHLQAHKVAEAGVARTFQNLALFDDLTVLENVLIGSHLRSNQNFINSLLGLRKTRREERDLTRKALDLLTFVDMRDHAGTLAGDLPQGLRRHLELARALAAEPQLLLLDEPAAGLNDTDAEHLGDLITKIGKTGVTVILIEHHMNLVMAVSDHVIVLDNGQVIAEGTPQEVQSHERVITAYLGTEGEKTDAQSF